MSPRRSTLPFMLAFLAASTRATAAIPQRSADGSVIVPQSATYHVRFTSPNPSSQHEAWRRAIATIHAVPGSTLRIVEDPMVAFPLAPVIGDGINSIAVMTTTDWPLYDPGKPFVVGCYGYECDVWFNNVDFNIVGESGSYAHERTYDAESLALSAFLMVAARMDNDIRFERVLYSHPPYGHGRSRLTLDETTWLRTVFGAPPPLQAIAGTVRRSGGPIAYAYVCAALAGGGDEVCVTTATNGVYSVRVPSAGSYRVVASPLTTNPAYLFTTPYRSNNPSNVSFLAAAYPTPVGVAAGQVTTGIDFDVSVTASMSEPSESQEPVSIGTDGTPVTFNAWPCGNEDRVTFASTGGVCYVIATRATGVAGIVGAARLERSETVLALRSGSTVLAQNFSRSDLDGDPRSLLLFCESMSRQLTVSVGQRQPDACGAGYYHDLRVKALASPPSPVITSPTSSSQRETRANLEELFRIEGSGFMPGASVRVGGVQVSVRAVEDCSESYECGAIVAETPATLPPGTYGVTVTNPYGDTAASASSFVILPVPGGSVFDMAWYGAFPLPTDAHSAEAMCWGDVDGDGDLDLFRTGDESTGGMRLLRNDRIGTGAPAFSDDTAAAGLPTDAAANPMFSCAFVDVDNDADLDLIVTFNPEATADSIRLYVNGFSQNGAVHFTEEASVRGVDQPSGNLYSKVFPIDFDNDGWMDLFVASNLPGSGQPYRPNRLYRNTGNGRFVDAADALVGMGATNHRTSDAIVGDFNADGWPDLVLLNIAVSGGQNGNALFLLNNGHGTFLDATAAAGINVSCNATTCNCTHGQAADFDNDGRLDFACFYYAKDSTTSPRLYLNDGVGTAAHFTDVASATGFSRPAIPQRFCPTMTVLDADLDGDQDLYLGCRQFGAASGEGLDLLLSNELVETGSLTFRNATETSGLSSQHGYAGKGRTDVATAVDWDGDLDDDIFISGQPCQLSSCAPVYDLAWGGIQNNPDFPRSLDPLFTRDSLEVSLEGRVSNIHGIGARVRAVRSLPSGVAPTVADCRASVPPLGEEVSRQMLADGHNQGPYRVELNWGAPLDPAHGSRVDCLDILWPSGTRQTLVNLPMHDRITVLEAADRVRVLRVEPNSGPVSGDTDVTIRGLGFRPGATVSFGTTAVTGPPTVSSDGTTITCRTPRWQPASTVDVTVVNTDSTGDALDDAFTYANTSEIEAVDPNPLMRAGPAVSADPVVLGSTSAPAVHGFAADGVTPVVLRLPVPSAGVVEFRLFDELRRTTHVGTLGAPGSTTGGATLTVNTSLVGNRNLGIAILRAPGSFWRGAGDDAAPQRPITIEATFRPASGGSTLYTSTLYVVRPPILLEHGIWSYPGTWKWTFTQDAGFVTFAHDYAASSDRSFRSNRLVPYQGVLATLEKFRNMGLAGTQVMVFAHSMGGVLSRIHASNTRTAYLRDDNFGRGDFYGLVTVDSPHLGSEVADAAIAIRDDSPAGPDLEFIMDKVGMNVRNGGLWDLQTTSYETTHLAEAAVPAHAFVGVGGSDMLAHAIPLPPDAKLAMKVLEGFGADPWTSYPPGWEHDLLVGRASQEGRLPTEGTTLFHYESLANMAVHFWSITRESNPNDRALEIMNTPIDDTSTWAAGFPAAPMPSPSTERLPRRRPSMLTPPLLAGTIAITSPAPNTVFHPGDVVPVSVQAGGFTPVRVLITVADSDAEVVTAAPWTRSLTMSQDALGTVMIRALAFDASQRVLRAEIPVQVASTTAALRALGVSPNDIGLLSGMLQYQLHVTGDYSDGISRDITSAAAGTVYESADPAVVTVSPHGLMTGVAVGSTTIMARNGSARASVAVRVKSLPAPLVFADRTTLSWRRNPDASGYDVVRGDLNALRSSAGDFRPSTTSCVVRNTQATTRSVAGMPASGNAFYFLYRFRLPGGPGSFDELPDYPGNPAGARDAEIAASAGVCAP